jgi:hypothetical protein
MRVKLVLVLFLFLMNGCRDTGKIVDNDLVGEWNNIYMKVDTRTKNNTDSSEVLEVDKDNWEEKLKIKPIRTYFRFDSTWNSAHYNLRDSLVYNPSGKWWIEGDSLIMQQLFPSPEMTSYKLTMNADTAVFECMYDWDMDGKKDDHYFGRQVKRK